jgi:hypothetical protein
MYIVHGAQTYKHIHIFKAITDVKNMQANSICIPVPSEENSI